MNPVSACTIASNNYLALAKVWAESYLTHHPGAEVFVCIADEPHPLVGYDRLPFEPVFASELDIPGYRNFAFRYDVVELNTAVKPYFLSHLHRHHKVDRLLYFDPDILVMDRLDRLERMLAKHCLLLTPHITRPLEGDHWPSERTIRQVGIYNLGFLGVRFEPESEEFLDWWMARLHRYCHTDPARGVFVDQSWMDFAPAFVEGVGIVRDPIYNVAYWNLSHRELRERGGKWLIDGDKVGFFHFSGVSFDRSDELSRHPPRPKLSDGPDLRSLVDEYRALVQKAGQFEYTDLPYGYAAFSGLDLRVPPIARRALARMDPGGARWTDPFEAGANDSFLGWLLEPLDFDAGTLNRCVMALWEHRADLRQAFPRVCEGDLGRYVDWLHNGGAAEAELAPELLTAVRAAPRGGLLSRDRGSPALREGTTPAGVSGILGRIDLANPGSWSGWLNQPVSRPSSRLPEVSRLAMLIHGFRPDLRAAFPDPLGRDRRRFAVWFSRHAPGQHGLHPVLTSSMRASFSPAARLREAGRDLIYLPVKSAWARRRLRKSSEKPTEAHPAGGPTPGRRRVAVDRNARPPLAVGNRRGGERGINLAGYFAMRTGVGQMGRATAIALGNRRVPFVRVHLDRQMVDPPSGIPTEDGAPFRVTLLHANADETPNALDCLPLATKAKGFTIGYWFWELSYFPRGYSNRFGYLSEIWAPSTFCQRAFETLATIPVRLVPPHVPKPAQLSADRSDLGLDPERFYFFTAVDAGSQLARKNPIGAIRALQHLQTLTRRPVGLVIKISQPELDPAAVQAIFEEARGLPVEIVTRSLPRLELDRMLASCDALLSLHRSEGLGLLPIEWLYLRKPVVATAYGGTVDYLDESTGYPVRYRLHALDRPYGPYPAGAVWADPDLDHAAEMMRKVVELPHEAEARAIRGLRRVQRIYGIEAAGSRLASEIARVYHELEVRGREVDGGSLRGDSVASGERANHSLPSK